MSLIIVAMSNEQCGVCVVVETWAPCFLLIISLFRDIFFLSMGLDPAMFEIQLFMNILYLPFKFLHDRNLEIKTVNHVTVLILTKFLQLLKKSYYLKEEKQRANFFLFYQFISNCLMEYQESLCGVQFATLHLTSDHGGYSSFVVKLLHFVKKC